MLLICVFVAVVDVVELFVVWLFGPEAWYQANLMLAACNSYASLLCIFYGSVHRPSKKGRMGRMSPLLHPPIAAGFRRSLVLLFCTGLFTQPFVVPPKVGGGWLNIVFPTLATRAGVRAVSPLSVPLPEGTVVQSLHLLKGSDIVGTSIRTLAIESVV